MRLPYQSEPIERTLMHASLSRDNVHPSQLKSPDRDMVSVGLKWRCFTACRRICNTLPPPFGQLCFSVCRRYCIPVGFRLEY